MCSAKVSRQSRSSSRQENPPPPSPCPRPRPRCRSGARPGSRWWPGRGWRPAPPSPPCPPPTSRVCWPRLPSPGRRSGSAASHWSSSWSPHSVCNTGQKIVSTQQNTLKHKYCLHTLHALSEMTNILYLLDLVILHLIMLVLLVDTITDSDCVSQ